MKLENIIRVRSIQEDCTQRIEFIDAKGRDLHLQLVGSPNNQAILDELAKLEEARNCFYDAWKNANNILHPSQTVDGQVTEGEVQATDKTDEEDIKIATAVHNRHYTVSRMFIDKSLRRSNELSISELKKNRTILQGSLFSNNDFETMQDTILDSKSYHKELNDLTAIAAAQKEKWETAKETPGFNQNKLLKLQGQYERAERDRAWLNYRINKRENPETKFGKKLATSIQNMQKYEKYRLESVAAIATEKVALDQKEERERDFKICESLKNERDKKTEQCHEYQTKIEDLKIRQHDSIEQTGVINWFKQKITGLQLSYYSRRHDSINERLEDLNTSLIAKANDNAARWFNPSTNAFKNDDTVKKVKGQMDMFEVEDTNGKKYIVKITGDDVAKYATDQVVKAAEVVDQINKRDENDNFAVESLTSNFNDHDKNFADVLQGFVSHKCPEVPAFMPTPDQVNQEDEARDQVNQENDIIPDDIAPSIDRNRNDDLIWWLHQMNINATHQIQEDEMWAYENDIIPDDIISHAINSFMNQDNDINENQGNQQNIYQSFAGFQNESSSDSEN